ncbi:MAG TPA: methyltransferase domain-containing protein [Vicinamibacterales bacterium]|nr:methyltransferase domain-containing protein [Vicinamibacterales bacterium]
MDRLLELTYRAEQSHFWFRGFRQYIKPALVRATEGRPSPRILDCGCGTGSNLEMLRPYGTAAGFDLTRIGAEFARAHGHRVVQASIGEIPFASGSIDLATSFDVFQVLPEDVEQSAIREMARVLKPGGWLLLHVAALQMLHGKHSVLSEEKRRYTPSRLRALVESAGFHIERLTFDHCSLLPIMLPVRVWHRMTAKDGVVAAGEGEITVPIAPVNAALTALVSLEAMALRVVNMPIGSSLMCLARKRQKAE